MSDHRMVLKGLRRFVPFFHFNAITYKGPHSKTLEVPFWQEPGMHPHPFPQARVLEDATSLSSLQRSTVRGPKPFLG